MAACCGSSIDVDGATVCSFIQAFTAGAAPASGLTRFVSTNGGNCRLVDERLTVAAWDQLANKLTYTDEAGLPTTLSINAKIVGTSAQRLALPAPVLALYPTFFETNTGVIWVYTAAGTWRPDATTTVANGTTIQTQSTVLLTKTSTGSVHPTYTDVAGLAVSLTPTSVGSKVLVCGDVCIGNNNGGGAAANAINYFGLKINGALVAVNAQNAIFSVLTQIWDYTYQASFRYLHTPASVAPQTYQLACAVSAGLMRVNERGVGDGVYPGISNITAMEIAGG